jgi:general secretion pathway protein D
MIKTILKTKDVYIDEKLNLLIMRDTPDAVRIAEKLIAGQDIAEPEVVLEVAVMEVVKRNADRYGIGASLEQVAPFTITIRDDYRIDGPATLSGAIRITARSTESSGNLLANPKIRVKNKEKARVLIGDRVPVISSSTTPVSGTGTTGASNIVVSQSVQYLDTGLKLEVEPLIHLEEDVQIKLNLEVNTLGDQTTTDQGTVAYRVGTRTANTTLRLKDGETATFSGLIRDDDVRDALKVPGLGDLPVLGRIFANRGTDVTRTEIVLAITPRIVRNVRHQMPSVTEIISGSETALRARLPGQRPVVESEALPLKGAPGAAPRPPAAPSPAPAEPAEPASSTAPTSEAPVSLAWHGTQAVRTGQEFLLALQGTSDQPLLSTAMQIAFDPNALRAVDVIEGDLLKREGAQTNFSQRVDQASGKIYVGLSRAGASGVSGTGSLILVKFAATAAPASPIQVTVFSGVGAGNKLLPANLPPPFELKMLP